MIFSSLTFLFFFVVVLALVGVTRSDRAKIWILLVASYVFYGAWDWRFLGLIAASSAWSWGFGYLIGATSDARRRKLYLAASVTCDLGLLAFFKYAQFFVDSFVELFDLESPGALGIILPVGISFFTFQSMSYTIDVYRKQIPVCRDAAKFFLFVGFFPQLVAGPIVRAAEFLPQLDEPIRLRRENLTIGAQVFLLGLVQKAVVADNVSFFVDPVFAAPTLYDQATLWLGMGAYGLQIFCDFSGYSLMAIGIARILGFTLPENFRAPYVSRSITEFWRRWHISLSFWLRDYLYISLGGNRRGKVRTDVNLMATMLLGGLWHGAGWNFVIWGALHGVGLVVHKHWARHVRPAERLPQALRPVWTVFAWALTLLFVLLLWVPFRCTSFELTTQYLTGLFAAVPLGVRWLHTMTLALLLVMVVWHLLHVGRGRRALALLPTRHPFAWLPLYLIGVLILALLLFAPTDASPFIYFQF